MSEVDEMIKLLKLYEEGILSTDDFYNNDEDDLEKVMNFFFGDTEPEPRELRCSDGQMRKFSFDEE